MGKIPWHIEKVLCILRNVNLASLLHFDYADQDAYTTLQSEESVFH
jgi:hypothetical protein